MRPHPVVVALALLAAGCSARPEAWAPSTRLADDLAAARGEPEAAVAAVGEVTRYVLAAPVSASVYGGPGARPVTTDARGRAAVMVSCPPTLAGRRALVTANVQAPRRGSREVRLRRPVSCPRGGKAAAVALVGLWPNTAAVPHITMRAPPPRRIRSQWLHVPRSAVLRAALGLADPRPLAAIQPARFRVRAEGRSGARLTLGVWTLDPRRREGDLGWRSVEVPLAAARRSLGAELRLVFETRPLGKEDALALPVWGDPTVFDTAAPGPAPTERNLLLVSIDTLRADRLGSYGMPLPTSPALDRLAAGGTLFEHTIAPAPHTLPAHATMFTGVYPCVHGFDQSMAALERRLPRRIVPLAEILRRQGYTTAAFTEDAFMAPGVFQRGFGSFRATESSNFHRPQGWVEDTVARAAAWLRRHRRERFFLFVHTYQVHWPYVPPARYARLFTPEDEPKGGNRPAWPAGAGPDLARYTAEVRYTDAVLAQLFAALERIGLERRTIVLVVSDHGEAFGEHGHYKHGSELYAEDIRVPMIWHAPGLVAARRRIRLAVVGLADVVPTVLELLGLDAPPYLQGISLAPVLTGTAQSAAELARRLVFSEDPLGRRLAVRSLLWKARLPPGDRTLTYFLPTDPGERHPLERGRFADLARRAREEHLAECRRLRERLATPQARAPNRLPPALERKLRALGYTR